MKLIKQLNFCVNAYMYGNVFFVLFLLLTTSAFCQDIKDNFITLEDFGVTANGKDETAGILKAFQFARQQKKSIKLLNGKVYIFSPAATVDITGIPEITGSGTFDVSNTGKNAGNPSMTTIFQLTGTKKLLQANISGMRYKKNGLQLSPGLNLLKGAVLFLTSAEPLANTKREYYSKGQRAIVKTYNNSTGTLVIEDSFFYSINKVYVWVNNQIPKISVGEKVRFITSPMNFISCFRMYYAEGFISGYFKNFALTAIMFKSSKGEVNNMEAELPVTENNGYSYCIMAGDMSLVSIKNCTLSGGRHVITGGGGGLWELEESGGKGDAGYPSVLTVDGGVYKGSKNVLNINADNATIDSHGVVEKMTIKNCTIYGGINLGANYVIVDNVILYADTKRAFNVGSDVLPGADWGNYTISNVKIIFDSGNANSVFLSKADIKEISLENVSVDNLSPQTIIMDFRNNSPKRVYINKLSSKQITSNNFIKISKSSEVHIANSDLLRKKIQRTD